MKIQAIPVTEENRNFFGSNGGIVTAAPGSATIGTLGTQQNITANGTNVPFTFTYNGTDQFIGLAFSHFTPNDSATAATANLEHFQCFSCPRSAFPRVKTLTPRDRTVKINNGFALDNLTVNATTAVPEPSSIVLFGCGLDCVAVRRRRRWANSAA